MADREGLMRRVLVMLGLEPTSGGSAKTITDCVERVDAVDANLEKIEQVTMAWTVDELSDEDRDELGLGE